MDRILRTDLTAAFGYPLIIAVLGDTHIQGPQRRIPEDYLEKIRQVDPSLIFHTGDIMELHVLEALERVAPVFAVRGNRDFSHRNRLPVMRLFQFGDTEICLLHGHGTIAQYLRLKVRYWQGKLDPEFIADQLPDAAANSRVVIFGHSHVPRVWSEQGKLFLNPGAFSEGNHNDRFWFPSFARFRIESPQKIFVEIHCKEDDWHVYCSKRIDWNNNGGAAQ